MSTSITNGQEPPRRETDGADAKDYIMELADRGELLLVRPLCEQMQVALQGMGFENVRIDREKVHDIFLLRARIGPNVDCGSVVAARRLLRRMIRQVGKRVAPGMLVPTLEGDRVRCALLFTDAHRESEPVDLDPVYHEQ